MGRESIHEVAVINTVDAVRYSFGVSLTLIAPTAIIVLSQCLHQIGTNPFSCALTHVTKSHK